MNLKSGEIAHFEGYSQFGSLKEFNTHFEMWLLEHKHDFSKGELVGLKQLARFAAKVPGVANAKIGTMLMVINEKYNNNGISRSTFKRMIQKAIKLGILTVYETERKNGSQSSNLYVFNRFPINEPPTVEKMNHHKETINLLKTNNQKINKRKDASELQQKNEAREPAPCSKNLQVLDHAFVGDHVPQAFVQLVRCFFPEARAIEEYWKMAQIAAYRNNSEDKTERNLDVAIQSFKQLIRKLKFTQSIKNPFAYFYGIAFQKQRNIFYEDLNEMESEDSGLTYNSQGVADSMKPVFDWLTANIMGNFNHLS